MHRLDQPRYGDGEHVPDCEAYDDESEAGAAARNPGGQHGGQGHGRRHRGVTRRKYEGQTALPLPVH